jgi:tetratricopeptide (TPR) repeat protein
VKPNETEALNLLAEVARRELDVSHAREEKARLYEAAKQAWEKGETTSALGKLEALIAMDRELPEVDAERISTYQNFYNHVHSAHDALKNAYEEARRNLSAGNLDSALATCKQYLSQYPNHALFKALQFDVEERQRQSLSAVIAETDRRVEQEPNLDKRMGILEEALKLYPGESHFERAVWIVRDKRDLVNSIVAKAGFFEESGQFSEALDQWQVLRTIHESQPDLDFEIERLMKRRDQQSRENAKARWVQMGNKYLESGDYDRAMKIVQSALAEFPGEAELIELEKLVRKNQELAAQARELLDRARECSERGALEESLQKLREAYSLDPRNTVIRTVLVNSLLDGARRSAGSEREAAVREVLSIDPNHAEAKCLTSQNEDGMRESAAPEVCELPSLQIAEIATPPPPQPVEPKAAKPVSLPPPVPSIARRGLKLVYAIASMAAVLAVLATGMYRRSHLKAAAPVVVAPPQDAKVSPEPSPPNVANRVDAPSPSPALLVTVSTDLSEGAVLLDAAPAAKVQGGEIELANVAPGAHKLSFQSGAFQGLVRFEIAAGAIPKVAGPIKASGLNSFVVARSGAEARLYSSVEGAQASLDGKPAGAISAEGLEMKELAPGPHELTIDAPGGSHHKIAFDSGPSNRLQASFVANQKLGALRILANDGATIYVNGEKYRRTTKNGRLVLYLAPKPYTVRVEKDGFTSPAEQVAVLKNGEETKVTFKLLPARASLAIRNAAPGTEVWLDGTRIGTVRVDNRFLSEVEPGKHVVALKNELYKLVQSEQVFLAGKTLEMEGRLEALLGILKIEVTPPGKIAHLRIRRESSTQDREITDTTLNLPEGAYIITGSAPLYQDAAATVQVIANRTTSASLVLKKTVATTPVQEKQRGYSLADWEKAGGWTREGTMLVRHGGDFVLAPVTFGPGSIVFTARVRRGKRLEWALNLHNQKNHYLFQIDDKNFSHAEIVNGKRLDEVKVPHGLNRKDVIGITIVLSANKIQHRVLQKGQWSVIDTWEQPESSLRSFAFHIPGRDEIALSDFQFTPK